MKHSPPPVARLPKRKPVPAWRRFLSDHRGWLASGAVTVAALAASAAYNHAATVQAEADYPPQGKFLEVDGLRLHYDEAGEGPVVVLLHGNGVTLDDFVASGVFAAAARNHRVIAFDRPGFGHSDRPRSTIWTPAAQGVAFATALRQLGISQAVIVGHSWGTMVALAMALDDPEIVRGLVLLSGYYYGTARPDVLPFSTPAIPGLGDIMAHTISPLSGMATLPAMLKASFSPAPVPPAAYALPTPLMLRPGQIRAAAAEAAIMVPAAVALSYRYGELLMPVRIMAGEGDLIAFPDTHARRLAGDIAGSALETFPGQGHMFHYAHPDAVVDAIAAVEAAAAAE